jgi:hypothetical protein
MIAKLFLSALLLGYVALFYHLYSIGSLKLTEMAVTMVVPLVIAAGMATQRKNNWEVTVVETPLVED